VSPNPCNFYQCDVCKYYFVLQEIPHQRSKLQTCKFAFLVARDITAIIIVIHAFIFFFGGLFLLADPEHQIAENYPNVHLVKHEWSKSTQNFVVMYEFGSLFLLFLTGLFGIWASCHYLCYKDTRLEEPRYPYNSVCGDFLFIYWIYPNYYYGCCSCDCHGGNCAGFGGGGNCNCNGNNGGEAIVIIVVIVVALVILFGLVVGTIFMVVLITKIVHRHMHILKRRRDAQIMRVVNLDGQPLPMQMPPTIPLLSEFDGQFESSSKKGDMAV
jgi:hypothetical protein